MEHPQSFVHLAALSLFARCPTLTAEQLAGLLGLEVEDGLRVVRDLEAAGYVARQGREP